MASASLPTFAKKCRKIVGVGRNYVKHAKELGNAVPSEPILFLKPPSSLLAQGQPILVPSGLSNIHHEVELGVVIGKGGSNISEETALSHVGGYFLGLDMTARSVQQAAAKKGLPWSVGKGYDTFAPISELIDAKTIDPADTTLWLKVDGIEKQRDSTKNMLFSVPFLISHISTIMSLEENDIIFSGTPEGVSAVGPGQTITCGIENNISMTFTVQAAKSRM